MQRICSPAIDGTYVDNAPVTRRPESRDSAPGQQKWAFEVYIEQPIPVVFACLLDRQLEHDACKRLNDEGVPGPSGREWRDTTIRGQVDRGTGLLNNSLYIGRLEWNRTAYVKNPRTGRKVARINKQEARETVEVPELRIVDDTLWEKVKGRQQEARIEMSKDESSNALNQAPPA